MTLYEYAREGDIVRLRDALHSENAAIRRRAAELLGEETSTSDPASVNALIKCVIRDSNQRVRLAAVDALAELGIDALDRLFTEYGYAGSEPPDIQTCARALQSRKLELRLAAIHLLAHHRSRASVPVLIETLDDSDARIRRISCQTLGVIGDPLSVEPLAKALTDEGSVRRAAAVALGQTETVRALAALVEELDSADPTVRRVATQALGNADLPEMTKHLLKRIGDPDPTVRSAAFRSSITTLPKLHPDRANRVRSLLGSMLERMDHSLEREILLEIVKETQDPLLREHAIHILGRIATQHDHETIDILLGVLVRGDDRSREMAARVLANVGGNYVRQGLFAVLDYSPSRDVRYSVAFILGEIGGALVSERLARLSADPDLGVRKQAIIAAKKLELDFPASLAEEGGPSNDEESPHQPGGANRR